MPPLNNEGFMDSKLTGPAAKIVRRARGMLLMLAFLAGCAVPAHAAGSADARQAMSGLYNVVGISERLHSGGFVRATGSGEMRLGSLEAGFRIEYRAETAELLAGCDSARASPCARRFVRNDDRSTVMYEGVVEGVMDGIAALRVTRAHGGEAPAQPLRAFVAPSGNVVIVPIEHGDGTTLLFATRRTPHHDSMRVAGSYAFSVRDAQLPSRTVARSGAWSSHRSIIRGGELSINHWYLAGHEQGSSMRQSLSCVLAAGGCSAAAVLEQEELDARAFAGFAISDRRGAVRMSWSAAGSGAATNWQGFAAPDGEFLALLEATRARGLPPRALALAIRPKPGASPAAVAGVFNVVALEEFFDSDSGIRLAYVNGAITFDAAGNWSFSGTDSARKRTECLASDSACPGALITSRAVQGGAGGAYVAAGSGAVTLDGLAGDNTPRRFVGEISASGSIMVLRRVGDGEACSFDCSGSQSFRSLIVAVRRTAAP